MLSYPGQKRLQWIAVSGAVVVILFFIFTNIPKSDEISGYNNSFLQAYALWPKLDMSPYWTISSFYLWVVAGFQAVLGNLLSLSLVTSGRLVSFLCWAILVGYILRKKEAVTWNVLVVLFNPYLLVYASRAHPLAPALLLFYLFWISNKRKFTLWTGLLLTLAVNFQVFVGGASAMFMPFLNQIDKKNILNVAKYVFFAILGVIVTWITWGGFYPKNFLEDSFYTIYHVNGKPSFGYLASIFLLSGSILWGIGERPFSEMIRSTTHNLAIVGGVALCCVGLLFSVEIMGIISIGAETVFGSSGKILYVMVYGLIGLGWLRVHRDHYMLAMGLLGAGILLVALPYFYERITIFACLAPCLGWCLNTPPKEGSSAYKIAFPYCIASLLCAILYNLYGAL